MRTVREVRSWASSNLGMSKISKTFGAFENPRDPLSWESASLAGRARPKPQTSAERVRGPHCTYCGSKQPGVDGWRNEKKNYKFVRRLRAKRGDSVRSDPEYTRYSGQGRCWPTELLARRTRTHHTYRSLGKEKHSPSRTLLLL